jgi:hypothetical protein
MAENRYPCPECGAILKPAKPVAEGKKLRCPKCSTVFAPAAAEAGSKPAAAGAKGAKRPKVEEEDEGGTYGLGADDEEATKEERKKAMGPVKDRRPKSTRGSAQAIATKPSNQMLATGTFFCVSCVISILVVLWPLVFPPSEKKEDEYSKVAEELSKDKPKKVMTPEERRQQVILGWVVIGCAVLAFAYNGFIAVGAVKMQSLESYVLAMTASILVMLPFEWALAYPAFYWFIRLVTSIAPDEYFWHFHVITLLTIAGWGVYIGIWNLKTLRDPEVMSGFEEEKPTD